MSGRGISAILNGKLTASGNTMSATGGSGTNTALSVTGSPATVSGNTLTASGGSSAVVANVNTATINARSTGNVCNGGSCSGTATSGSVGFTDGTSCQ